MEGPRKLLCAKTIFLSNNNNKQSFINYLGQRLTEHGVNVSYCVEDANVEIVGKAIDLVKIRSVLLYGDDTDLLVGPIPRSDLIPRFPSLAIKISLAMDFHGYQNFGH